MQQTTKPDVLPNPERGCGHLERKKAYIRGVIGHSDGTLPSFVELDEYFPFREIGTDGSFTRGYQHIDGLSLEISLNAADYTFQPRSPVDYEEAYKRMVEIGMYKSRLEIPETEHERHIDRLEYRSEIELNASHWGALDIAGHHDLLMRAGESYYEEPEDFIEEAVEHGLSKAIPVSPNEEPPTVIPGITKCWIMHPNARPDDEYGGGIIGYAYLGEVVFTEPEEGDVPEYINEYEQQDKIRTVDIEDPESNEHSDIADISNF